LAQAIWLKLAGVAMAFSGGEAAHRASQESVPRDRVLYAYVSHMAHHLRSLDSLSKALEARQREVEVRVSKVSGDVRALVEEARTLEKGQKVVAVSAKRALDTALDVRCQSAGEEMQAALAGSQPRPPPQGRERPLQDQVDELKALVQEVAELVLAEKRAGAGPRGDVDGPEDRELGNMRDEMHRELGNMRDEMHFPKTLSERVDRLDYENQKVSVRTQRLWEVVSHLQENWDQVHEEDQFCNLLGFATPARQLRDKPSGNTPEVFREDIRKMQALQDTLADSVLLGASTAEGNGLALDFLSGNGRDNEQVEHCRRVGEAAAAAVADVLASGRNDVSSLRVMIEAQAERVDALSGEVSAVGDLRDKVEEVEAAVHCSIASHQDLQARHAQHVQRALEAAPLAAQRTRQETEGAQAVFSDAMHLALQGVQSRFDGVEARLDSSLRDLSERLESLQDVKEQQRLTAWQVSRQGPDVLSRVEQLWSQCQHYFSKVKEHDVHFRFLRKKLENPNEDRDRHGRERAGGGGGGAGSDRGGVGRPLRDTRARASSGTDVADEEDSLFDKVDQNHDGVISREELARAVRLDIVHKAAGQPPPAALSDAPPTPPPPPRNTTALPVLPPAS